MILMIGHSIKGTSDISKAKGFLVKTDSLPVGETLTLTITIDPSGQNQKMSWSIIFALTLI